MAARSRPILFSGEMVRAILEGRKTQTRRVLSRQPPSECGIHYMLGNESWKAEGERSPLRHSWEAWGGPLYESRPTGHMCGHFEEKAPYMPEDRLWVRETWSHDAASLEDLRVMVENVMGSNCGPYYRADGVHEGSGLRWRPSIHMPRWASRLTLEVISVRVERLRDISDEDALAEGVDPCECTSGPATPDAVSAFAEVWDLINSKRCPWSSDPWVWAVTFRRLT